MAESRSVLRGASTALHGITSAKAHLAQAELSADRLPNLPSGRVEIRTQPVGLKPQL